MRRRGRGWEGADRWLVACLCGVSIAIVVERVSTSASSLLSPSPPIPFPCRCPWFAVALTIGVEWPLCSALAVDPIDFFFFSVLGLFPVLFSARFEPSRRSISEQNDGRITRRRTSAVGCSGIDLDACTSQQPTMLAMQHRRTRTRARVSVRPAVLHGGMRRVHSSVRRVGGSDALYREGVQRVRDPSPRLVDVRRVRAESVVAFLPVVRSQRLRLVSQVRRSEMRPVHEP